ncbi:MAG: type I DNA topoisomerase [Bacteroides sp.]|nr:type I DNA topoisomerase [Bacillota bacterium]MCM1394143.1 type I DNA topoisomerase [[Eubacterium] siraeum]MCM1455179.1 type I DNA topoisomerase [Bacteroides sp.]
MKQLIIVESPHKAKTIQKYLGSEAQVLASKGHVCDLPQRSLGIDIENGYKPQYVVSEDKEATIKQLSQAVKKYDKVYLATDPDREGEAISWHLKNVLGIDEKEVRIEFNEISPKAVRAAMKKPREINMDLVDSQQARRVLDRLVGYKISPILSRKLKPSLSAGRVQSAALKMIVDREKEIRAFVPEEYWNINAILLKAGAQKTKANLFNAALNDSNGKKIKVVNEEEAGVITSFMRRCGYVVDEVKKSVSISKPAPPFTTSTMQQEASHKLGFTADRTSRIAQSLYEGVNIEGEGLHALITYIRTDSVRISPDFARATLGFIADNYGEEYAPKSPNVYKTSENAQDAHEAIRPIDLSFTPKSLEGKMDKDAFRLYKLIYERYMASQMSNAQYNTMRVHILGSSGSESLGFVVKGKSIKFKGYTAVYSATVEEDEDEKEIDTMPDLNEGDRLSLEDVLSEQKFTKPPARYNDATLVKALEENGIGRPSTYASIISVLAKREYTEKQQKSIAPTQLGEAVCEYMEHNFPDIMSLDFTARLEGALDKVAEGNQQWQELIGAFYPRLQRFLDRAAKASGGNYLPDEESDVVCDKCGAKMVVRHGKYGPFLACPNYPRCKNIKKIVEVVGKCPKCGGDVSKRVSKSGKTFYGCTNYPKCDFISWDIPAPYFCPDCGNTMKVVKRDDKTYYVCTDRQCKHRELVKTDGEDE